MSKISTAVILGALFLPVSANGQVVFQGFEGTFANGVTLLRVEEVQRELKIDEKQNARIKEVIAPFRQRYDERIKELGRLPPERASMEFAKLTQVIGDETMRAVAEVLQPAQLRRFKQIRVQKLKDKAFQDAEVQIALKLTDDQKKQLQIIADEQQKKLLREEALTAEMVDKSSAEHIEKVLSVLTDRQRETWKDLVGPEFKIKPGMLLRLK